jgi:hypothetical protein
MALGKDPYRRFCPPDLERLRESVSVLAERVYLHLALGRYSRASNATRISLDGLRVEVREHSRSKVEDALQELQAQNWLCIDWMTLTVWLPMQAQRCASDSPKTRQGYLEEIAKLPPCAQRTQAYEFAQSGAIPYGYGIDTVGIGYGSKKQKKKQKQEFSYAIATETAPAIAVEPRLALPVEAEPQAIEPELDQSVWADIKPTVPGLADPDYRPKSKLLPHLQHKLAVNDAKAKGILPSEPPQLAMDLPAGKPKRALTDSQLDAIFAKRKLREVVDHWNENLAGTNAPCDFKAVEKLAGTLMGNFAKYQHRDVFDDARCLFGWAMAVDRYHSGRDLKKWSFQQWLSAEHLSLVFAAYRAHKGEGRQLSMDLNRTLRDWRLAVETAELNNKIAAANNEH